MIALNGNLFAVLSSRIPEFSKGHRRIADYILTHYDKAAFMTASKLGESVGVSESTVVRFASELGFDGYPELQKSLQEEMRTRLTAVQRIEVSFDRFGHDEVFKSVLLHDIDSRQTVYAINYARDIGAKAIAITDQTDSPIAERSNKVLLAKSDMVSFVDSLVAPLSLINALIVAVSIQNKELVSRNFERLDRIWEEYDVYEKNGGGNG